MAEATFCCFWSLQNGALFAAHFTSLLSCITCATASAVFFRSTDRNDDHSKLTALSIICYCIIYIYISRKLIQGIKDDDREKLLLWMTMTCISVILLTSGSIFVLVSYGTEIIPKRSVPFPTVIGVSTACLIIAYILTYCIWNFITLWKYMGEDHDAETEVV